MHRVVPSQDRPGELAEADSARRADLGDRFGAGERRGRRGRGRRRRGAAIRRGIRVHHRVHTTTARHASLILGAFLAMQDLQAPVNSAQEMGDLLHRRTIHLPVRLDLRNNFHPCHFVRSVDIEE